MYDQWLRIVQEVRVVQSLNENLQKKKKKILN